MKDREALMERESGLKKGIGKTEMDGWMKQMMRRPHRQTDRWMNGWIDGWVDLWIADVINSRRDKTEKGRQIIYSVSIVTRGQLLRCVNALWVLSRMTLKLQKKKAMK